MIGYEPLSPPRAKYEYVSRQSRDQSRNGGLHIFQLCGVISVMAVSSSQTPLLASCVHSDRDREDLTTTATQTTHTMRTISVLTSLLALDAASAFIPRKTSNSPSAGGAWGLSKATTSVLQAKDDDNFDGIDLKKLLSAKQLKRMARVKRQSNQATSAPEEKPASKKAPAAKPKGPVKIIIAGAPASGKGTQCEIIKEKFDVVHLSTGDMLRASVEAQTEVGKLAKEYMDSGKLVPDEVIIGVVRFPFIRISIDEIPRFRHGALDSHSRLFVSSFRSKTDSLKRIAQARAGCSTVSLAPRPKLPLLPKRALLPIAFCF